MTFILNYYSYFVEKGTTLCIAVTTIFMKHTSCKEQDVIPTSPSASTESHKEVLALKMIHASYWSVSHMNKTTSKQRISYSRLNNFHKLDQMSFNFCFFIFYLNLFVRYKPNLKYIFI